MFDQFGLILFYALFQSGEVEQRRTFRRSTQKKKGEGGGGGGGEEGERSGASMKWYLVALLLTLLTSSQVSSLPRYLVANDDILLMVSESMARQKKKRKNVHIQICSPNFALLCHVVHQLARMARSFFMGPTLPFFLEAVDLTDLDVMNLFVFLNF